VNEAADRLAGRYWSKRPEDGAETMPTHKALREVRKALRAQHRQEPGFGKGHTQWDKHALVAYTWLRTNRGLFPALLHHLKKAESPACR